MGYAIARAAARRGADVILVSGPTDLNPPPGLSFCQVITAEDMRRSVFENRSGCDIIIKAAAVSDYRPRDCAEQKIKKGAESISLELVKNPDILAELGSTTEEFPSVLVGFAAETEDLIVNAEKKTQSKKP